jgi:hypothetical protein
MVESTGKQPEHCGNTSERTGIDERRAFGVRLASRRPAADAQEMNDWECKERLLFCFCACPRRALQTRGAIHFSARLSLKPLMLRLLNACATSKRICR